MPLTQRLMSSYEVECPEMKTIIIIIIVHENCQNQYLKWICEINLKKNMAKSRMFEYTTINLTNKH